MRDVDCSLICKFARITTYNVKFDLYLLADWLGASVAGLVAASVLLGNYG